MNKTTRITALFIAVLLLLSLNTVTIASGTEDNPEELKTMTASIMPYEGLTYTGDPQIILNEGTLYAVENGTEVSGLHITYATEQDGEYTAQQPEFTDAGTYTVYYRIEADGYEPVLGHHAVTIQKMPVNITWSLTDDGFSRMEDTFSRSYDGTAFSMPIASLNSSLLSVSLLSGPNGTCGAVGDYVFQATLNDNYATVNPTCTVRIIGQNIASYALTGNGEVWYDGEEHSPAVLTVGTPADADVTYSWSDDGGTTWKEDLLTMPTFAKTGRYTMKADIARDGYYPETLLADFRIKAAKYQVESSDFVTGWDLVLVYTNDENVSFTYDGMQMYDVSSLGYRYGTTVSEGGKAYSYVYGCLVKDTANQTKVVSSNAAAGNVHYTPEQPCDVNGSGSIDLYDLVAAQAVYNVNEEVLSTHMDTALKADVNRDKKVDTNDAAYIKSNHP